MNPNFDAIGKQFVSQYYQVFDNKEMRPHVAQMYLNNQVPGQLGLLSFEGNQFQGMEPIAEKMKNIPLDNMQRVISTIDCQPMYDGGILVSVVGQLKNQAEHDKPLQFCQTFVLKPVGDTFFISHDMFRLCLHNIAS